MLDLLDFFDWAVVLNGFAGEPAPDCIDRVTSNLEDRSPGGLKRDGRSCFSNGGIQTADSRLATFARDPNYEPREGIEPWVEHNDPSELEEATERRHREHAVRIVKSSTDPICGSREWSEKQDR